MKISPRPALLAGAITLLGTAASATTYTYQTISVPDAIQTNPVAINDSGTEAGDWYDSNFTSHGWVYSGGTLTSFDVPNAAGTVVAGINNTGDIVGTYDDSNHVAHGFIRSAKGKLSTIDVPASTYTGVNGINNKGVMVITAQDPSGYQAVFTYDKGVFTTIIDNQQNPAATSINDQGSVAGFNQPLNADVTAFLYANGTLTTLPLTQYTYAAALGLNKHNEVVGAAANGGADYTEYGFIYSPKGKVKFIGPSGSAYSLSSGVNDSGVVVGTGYDSSGNSVGYSYAKGMFSTVSVTGGTDGFANAINNAGQVMGGYRDTNNIFQTFLATPQK
jgi:hypothetical protein